MVLLRAHCCSLARHWSSFLFIDPWLGSEVVEARRGRGSRPVLRENSEAVREEVSGGRRESMGAGLPVCVKMVLCRVWQEGENAANGWGVGVGV